MYDFEIVPLEEADTLFAAFGVGPGHREYERWRRAEGFRLDDLDDVLGESPRIIVVDWRSFLEEALEQIAPALETLGVELDYTVDDDGNHGVVRYGNRSVAAKYAPDDDDDDFDAVVRDLVALVDGRVEFRSLWSARGSDTYVYGVLAPEEWRRLRAAIPALLIRVFVPPGAPPDALPPPF